MTNTKTSSVVSLDERRRAPRCEGDNHGTTEGRAWGHDRGPARFRVGHRCSGCGSTGERLLCAGRVHDMLTRTIPAREAEGGEWCDDCGVRYPRIMDYLFVESLEEQPTSYLPPGKDEPRAGLLDEFTEYLSRRRRSAETIRKRRYVIGRMLDDLDPTTVDTFALDEWVRGNWTTAETVNQAMSALRLFFRWQQASGRRGDDPAAELETVKVLPGRPRVASDEAILAGIDGADVATEAMIRLGAECGLRRHEIAKVHQDDIDGDVLHVRGKGGKHRTVIPGPDLLVLLRDLGPGFLFPGGTHGHLHPNTVYERIRRAVGANTHALRHRAGTVVYERTGHNLRVTQTLLGHSSLEMTARYVHVSDRDLRLAADAAVLSVHKPTPPADPSIESVD